MRHAWTIIPPLPVQLAHECVYNQSCKDSALVLPLPGPAEPVVMNWRIHIHFHGNKHPCPRATPRTLCKCHFPIKPNPWETSDWMQKQQDPAHRVTRTGARLSCRARLSDSVSMNSRWQRDNLLNWVFCTCFFSCWVFPCVRLSLLTLHSTSSRLSA